MELPDLIKKLEEGTTIDYVAALECVNELIADHDELQRKLKSMDNALDSLMKKNQQLEGARAAYYDILRELVMK